jgi:hypothetical protein
LQHPEDNSRPQLATGCRIAQSQSEELTVLFPEGALLIKGTGREILTRCNGQRTFLQIVGELQSLYTSSDSQKIKKEAGDFLERLRGKRIIDY